MATYISLVNWTEQGIRDIKASPKRVDAVKALCRANGAEMTALYMTMGNYDLVSIIEAPSDEVVAKILLDSRWRRQHPHRHHEGFRRRPDAPDHRRSRLRRQRRRRATTAVALPMPDGQPRG